MKDLFNLRWDKKTFLALLFFMLASILVYYAFFDILIPGAPGDSYRLTVGWLFIIPVLVLAFGQVGIGGFFLHMVSKVVNPKRSDYLRALLVVSVMVFCFSLIYSIFPHYGPFYFVVFIYQTSPYYAFPVVALWSLLTIGVTTYLAHKIIQMPYWISFISAALTFIFIAVAAS